MTCSTFLGSAKTPTIQPTHWLRGRIRGPPGGRFNLYVEIFLPMRDPWDGTGIFTDHEWLIFMVNPYFTNMILHEWLIKSWYIPFFSHFSIFFLWLFVHFLEIQGPQAPPKNPKTEQRPETSDPILPGAKGLETMVSQLSIKNTGCFFWGSLKKSPQICGQEISSPKTTRANLTLQ